MTTSSATGQHPYDLLDAFSLDALEPDEEQSLIDHLELCSHCSALADQNLQAAAALASSVLQQQPPEYIRAKVLDSLGLPVEDTAPSVSVSVPAPRPPRSWSRVTSIGSRWARFLVPAGAALAVALIAVTVALNVQIAGDIDNLQSENASLRNRLDQSLATTSALARSSSTVSQMEGNVQRWQQTSLALAQQGNQTVLLSATQPGAAARGFLVLSVDGFSGILMASQLAPPRPDSVYHVWLTKGGQRFWEGELAVDNSGIGAMQLIPGDSLLNYDAIQVSQGMGVAAALAAPPGSAERARATANMVGDMILVAQLR